MDYGYIDNKHRHWANEEEINSAIFTGTMCHVRNHVRTELVIPIEERTLSAGNSVGLNTKSHFENRPTE